MCRSCLPLVSLHFPCSPLPRCFSDRTFQASFPIPVHPVLLFFLLLRLPPARKKYRNFLFHSRQPKLPMPGPPHPSNPLFCPFLSVIPEKNFSNKFLSCPPPGFFSPPDELQVLYDDFLLSTRLSLQFPVLLFPHYRCVPMRGNLHRTRIFRLALALSFPRVVPKKQAPISHPTAFRHKPFRA